MKLRGLWPVLRHLSIVEMGKVKKVAARVAVL